MRVRAPFRRRVEPLWECWLESLTLLPLLVPLLSQEHEDANNRDSQDNERPSGFYRDGVAIPAMVCESRRNQQPSLLNGR